MSVGSNIVKGLGLAAAAAGPASTVLAGVIKAVVVYRQARAAWKLAHPEAPAGTPDGQVWLEDADLIDLLKQDSAALVAKADGLLDKYKAADSAEPPPVG